MASLRFNPYYSLVAYGTVEDGPTSPLNEGEQVTMELVFAFTWAPAGASEAEDLKMIRAKLVATLLPSGEEFPEHNYTLCRLRSVGARPQSHAIKFPSDKDNIIQAVITIDDSLTDFPFQSGQVILVPMKVRGVKGLQPAHETDWTWQTRLAPLGEEVGGLTVANVELAKK